MSKFRKIVESPIGSKFILQGNAAFALGVVHAGYHAANGYPGTPSTEVIDKSLSQVQDRIKVDWAVNEAVAVGVGIGHAVAGYDSVVTMKTPGVFQAGDAISTSAFNTVESGAFVIYAVTDYVPSSTQHVIDTRYFFASCRLPVLEPRNHQEMYEIAWTAADISRKFNTPVVVLGSGILAHSEGLVKTKPPRIIESREVPENLHDWMLMPSIARSNYNKATINRIPGIQEWAETSSLIKESVGTDDFGIIVNGEADIIVREALNTIDLYPSILSLSMANPIPKKKISEFAEKFNGNLYIIEDGGKFIEEKIRLMGIKIRGKDELSVITNWEPETIIEFLSKYMDIKYKGDKKKIEVKPVRRPPSICPGCPYRVFGLVVQKLKKKKKLYASFGDIGCSTLLYFLGAVDTVLCMGASDSMRQGFTLSRPELASKVISVIGDSCECHSGLDSTRNAVFRNTPGVKVILDNRTTAMTGGQPAPSSETNLKGIPNKFVLKDAVKAEKGRTVVADSFNLKEVERVLKEALSLAEEGEFSTLILEGRCMQEIETKKKIRKIDFNYENCKRCGLCDICPGIEFDDEKRPKFTNLCNNCGSNKFICMQICPHGAIELVKDKEGVNKQDSFPGLPKLEDLRDLTIEKHMLPGSLRVAIRGVGGQGNLFFGNVLSEVAMRTQYAETNIVKGDTHGMARLGGSVISTFACGKVFSSVLAPNSVDILVVMENNEVLQPGFLDLLKPGGNIIFNNFRVVPSTVKDSSEYPDIKDIEKTLEEYNVTKIDANKVAYSIGDKTGRVANVVVLGLLSTMKPFNLIPEQIFLSALMSVSPSDLIKSVNLMAFKAGREYLGLKK